MRNVHDTLLARSDDWLQYAIRMHLLDEPKQTLATERKLVLADERIRFFLADVADFHGTIVSNHKNPDLPLHKLMFLLDIGLDTDVPEIEAAICAIRAHRDSNGVYQSMTNIPKHFGGTGEDVFSWCLCDAPRLFLCLVKAGLNSREYLEPGLGYLVSLIRENGFPCATSPELGRFRGPGRKDDCCPYATLIMADLLAAVPEYMESAAAETAVNALLGLWTNSREQHPYMFYMGRDFRKLKAPSNWYDIVSVAGVLSQYPSIHGDPRFKEMISLITQKADADGLYTPESVYLKMKGWDYGQKKAPSAYLTYLILRILKRLA